MTPQSPLSLLLVTGDALVAGTLESHLGFVFPGLTIRRAQTLSAAVSAQASEPPDAVLADLAWRQRESAKCEVPSEEVRRGGRGRLL